VEPEEGPGTALDTSVIIASLLTWHEHHRAASAAVAPLLEGRERVVLLTLNSTHFVRIGIPGIEIVVPGRDTADSGPLEA
jgi:predicted nucleic acid-binding protein